MNNLYQAQTIRTFIAIDINQEVKKKILDIQKKFSLFPLTVPKKETFHLTLVFLGEIPQGKIGEVFCAVEEATQKIAPFTLDFANLGAFPNLKLPKIVWIGLKGELGTLFTLERRLKISLLQKGFDFQEEPFIPHITFGRVKSFANRKIRKQLGEALQRFGPLPSVKIICNTIAVFASQPTSAGYIHQLLKNVPLKT